MLLKALGYSWARGVGLAQSKLHRQAEINEETSKTQCVGTIFFVLKFYMFEFASLNIFMKQCKCSSSYLRQLLPVIFQLCVHLIIIIIIKLSPFPVLGMV